jgi:hypothetical protein
MTYSSERHVGAIPKDIEEMAERAPCVAMAVATDFVLQQQKERVGGGYIAQALASGNRCDSRPTEI